MTFKFLNLDKFSKLIPQENNDLNKLNIKCCYYTNYYNIDTKSLMFYLFIFIFCIKFIYNIIKILIKLKLSQIELK